ncbi:hypothetical protein O6P43_006515 [Quillaja saponaria]|uniref:Uncharacterized protein n=1 Tax=Quillaja saponaria TaxID=32244 RepID=A0AAD7Q8N3_QUISA|nr:hypothetical protein O6P43_006515 [Quillaja saponaria]
MLNRNAFGHAPVSGYKPGQLTIRSSSKEVRWSIPSGRDNNFGHLEIESFWSDLRFINHSGSAAKLGQPSICMVCKVVAD